MAIRFDLRCPACDAVVSCGPAEMTIRLRQIGKLRRAAEPEPEVLVELFVSAAGQFRCDACGHVGLTATPSPDDDSDWGSRPCEACGRPIPAERLELLPGVKFCAACQQRSDTQGDLAEAEYCPRCGSIMTLKQSRAAGVTRYVMTCPECRR